MSIVTEAQDAIRPWVVNPWARLKFEIYCIRRALIPHDDNNDFRKLLLLILLLTWSALVLGIGKGAIVPGGFFWPFTAFLMLIIGRMWGVEVDRIALPIELENDTDDQDDQQDGNSK